MIPIPVQAEPLNFDQEVRRRGADFLKHCSSPTPRQWMSHAYWRAVEEDMHRAYSGICAYSCHYIPRDAGSRSIDHFRPKSLQPELAYEWSNYRLSSRLLNARKGDRTVVDPFTLVDGWFVLDFPSLLVKPGATLGAEDKRRVIETIELLGLNDESTCMHRRAGYMLDYCRGEISFNVLRRDAPFLARELERQGLVEEITRMMG